MSVFTYHIFTVSAKPLRNEIALVISGTMWKLFITTIFFQIIGSDSKLGRAFATQMIKMDGTVICIDDSKEKGDAFVKAINDGIISTRAYFYACDISRPTKIKEVIDKATSDIGDISILLNCAPSSKRVAIYFEVFYLRLS